MSSELTQVNKSLGQSEYDIRYEMLDGKKHIVVPTIMMAEGVHNGSHGKVFHSANELSKYPAAWNGIPVVIYHPEEDGINVSANSPSIHNSSVVGRVFGTCFDDNKLRAEVWLDESKVKNLSPESYTAIMNQTPLDVSVGVFTDDEEVDGDWNGEIYTAVSKNHRPDHLALLPGSRGACSWEDGCGIRANEEKQESINGNINNNSKGGSQIMSDQKCCPEKVELLIQSENVRFGEDHREWLETLEESKIDELLELADVADENAELKGQIEDLQARLLTLEKRSKDKVQPATPQMNTEQAVKVLREHLSDPDRFLGLLPDDTRRQMEHGLRLHQAYRQDLVSKIKENAPEGVYSDQELLAMEDHSLEKLSKLVKPRVDYSPLSVHSRMTSYDSPVEPLLPPGVRAQ